MLKARGDPLGSYSPNLCPKQSHDTADAVEQMLSRGKGSHGLLATKLLMEPRLWTATFSPRHVADSSWVCCFLISQLPSYTIEWEYSTLAILNAFALSSPVKSPSANLSKLVWITVAALSSSIMAMSHDPVFTVFLRVDSILCHILCH